MFCAKWFNIQHTRKKLFFVPRFHSRDTYDVCGLEYFLFFCKDCKGFQAHWWLLNLIYCVRYLAKFGVEKTRRRLVLFWCSFAWMRLFAMFNITMLYPIFKSFALGKNVKKSWQKFFEIFSLYPPTFAHRTLRRKSYISCKWNKVQKKK